MIALCGALIALVLLPVASALAAGTQVRVRVEGKDRTLVTGTGVQTHSGSITKAGAPAGSCPATSAAGALDGATHHRWGGIYSSSLGQLALTSILGEAWPFTQANYYWGVWVNDRYATTGMCQITLHRSDHLLFAVDSVKHHEHPLGLSGPRRAHAGQTIRLKVVWFSDKGVAKSQAGAHVHGSGLDATTNRHGIVSVRAQRTGTQTYTASKSGSIRSARLNVRVS